jgi:hypothetical protein
MAFDRRKQATRGDFAARVAILLMLDPMLQCDKAKPDPGSPACRWRATVPLDGRPEPGKRLAPVTLLGFNLNKVG